MSGSARPGCWPPRWTALVTRPVSRGEGSLVSCVASGSSPVYVPTVSSRDAVCTPTHNHDDQT